MVRRRVCIPCKLTIMTVEAIYDVRTSRERFNAQRDGGKQRLTRRQKKEQAVAALTAGMNAWR